MSGANGVAPIFEDCVFKSNDGSVEGGAVVVSAEVKPIFRV